jgi:hypothetical protein
MHAMNLESFENMAWYELNMHDNNSVDVYFFDKNGRCNTEWNTALYCRHPIVLS